MLATIHGCAIYISHKMYALYSSSLSTIVLIIKYDSTYH